MEMSALWKLSYGMYAIGTLDGERPTGCIVNTVIQITSDNPVIAISMNKNNYTYDCICLSKHRSYLQFICYLNLCFQANY